MRISRGIFARRPLICVPIENNRLRPTAAKIREACFNQMVSYFGSDWMDMCFLDLFAGTGAIGIEAFSQGARHVTFVDSQGLALEGMRKNFERLGIKEGTFLFQADLHIPWQGGFLDTVYDVIFLDPPYEEQNIEFYLQEIDSQGVLAKHGLIFFECCKKVSLQESYGNFFLKKCTVYGRSKLSVYARS